MPPEPMELFTLAERFWQHAPGPETEELQEPARSAMVVKNFLIALNHHDQGTAKDSPALIAMLRRAEVEGDPSYASPEQLRGETLDTRAVIFSLGVLLFERLTGRHPFGAENNRPRRMDRIRRGEMGSGVNSFPTIPAGLRSVLVRAMSPFAEERWADLRELRNALRTTSHELPAPKLPGASETPPNTDRDVTKVVRMPTEFGQELMNVVAEHDGTAKPATVPPPVRRTGRQSAQPETVPAGVAKHAVAREKPPSTPPPVAPPREVMRAATPVPEMIARAVSEPRMRRPPRTGLIAMTAGLVGAAVALAVVFAMGVGSKDKDATENKAVTAPVAAPVAVKEEPPVAVKEEPPVAVAVPVPVPVKEEPPPVLAPSPPTPTPAPTPTPVSETPPASPSAIEERIAAVIAPCLEEGAPRVFGLSLAISKSAVVKAYYGSDDPLSQTERACISAAIRGVTGDGAPTSGDLQYKVRGGAAGVTLTAHVPRRR